MAYLLLGAQVGHTDRQPDPSVRAGLRPAACNVTEARGDADGGQQAALKQTQAGTAPGFQATHNVAEAGGGVGARQQVTPEPGLSCVDEVITCTGRRGGHGGKGRGLHCRVDCMRPVA